MKTFYTDLNLFICKKYILFFHNVWWVFKNNRVDIKDKLLALKFKGQKIKLFRLTIV